MNKIMGLILVLMFAVSLYANTDWNSGIAVKSPSSALLQYDLGQNYPNPFNPETTIKFSIPRDEYVSVKVFNIIGQVVKTLVSDNLTKGEYEVVFDANELTSGIYLYTLTAGNFTQTKRMMLVK